MKIIRSLFSVIFFVALSIQAVAQINLPDSIFSGYQGKHHVQGIAVDVKNGWVYFSFTTRLIKTDLEGNLIGSVEGFTGHLGCLALNPDDGRVYGSLEYKNDEIGVGIAGEAAKNRRSAFYIAVFDGKQITRADISATDHGVMSAIYLGDVVDDFYASVSNKGKTVEHRYGCSGIDGIAFAPKPGKPKGEKMLYVAYGIYGDTERSDNDYQVFLTYDVKSLKKYEHSLQQDCLTTGNSPKPWKRFFAYTGNTNWGIQNMTYYPQLNSLLAAVYSGSKKSFPNYNLYAIDLEKKPKTEVLKGFDNGEKGYVLPLKKMGKHDGSSDTYGWNFPYGSTGLSHIVGDLFYISHNATQPEQSSTLFLYRWTGNPDSPFVKITQ